MRVVLHPVQPPQIHDQHFVRAVRHCCQSGPSLSPSSYPASQSVSVLYSVRNTIAFLFSPLGVFPYAGQFISGFFTGRTTETFSK
ncbi:hypothetical protein BDV18DRAFT_138494 [Aspergillus unguis]